MGDEIVIPVDFVNSCGHFDLIFVQRCPARVARYERRGQQPPEIVALEERLRSHLGAKVNLRQYSQGGIINIRYFSDEELNALLDLLLPEEQ